MPPRVARSYRGAGTRVGKLLRWVEEPLLRRMALVGNKAGPGKPRNGVVRRTVGHRTWGRARMRVWGAGKIIEVIAGRQPVTCLRMSSVQDQADNG